MQEVILDFESYYNTKEKYSLRAMPNVLYVRDSKYKAHGVGIHVLGQKPEWRTDVAAALAEIDWANAALIGHNLYHDGLVLIERFGHRPAEYRDTLGMARALLPVGMDHDLDTVAKALGHTGKIGGTLAAMNGIRDLTPTQLAKLGDYCLTDLAATLTIYEKLWPAMPEVEHRVLSMTTRMGVESPIELDQKVLERVVQHERDKAEAAIEAGGVARSTLSSNPKFQALLESRGYTVPMKQNKNSDWIPALAQTDAEYVTFRVDNPELEPLFAARKAVKSRIGETRALRFLEISQTERGTLPMAYKYYGAHTGRFSGMDKLNVQNLPRLDKSDMRRALIAPEGKVIVVVDSAQIELRTQLWFSGQLDLLQKLADGEDLYRFQAAAIYQKPEGEITKLERGIGKATLLGSQYGMGATKYRLYMAGGPLGLDPIFLTPEEAALGITGYRASNPYTVAMWKTLDQLIPLMTQPDCDHQLGPIRFVHEGVELPNGMRLDYTGLRNDGDGSWMYGVNGETKFLWGGTLLENCLAEGTLVLTDSGWKPIEQVTKNDLVHDGVEWVTHGGSLLSSPRSTCVKVDGVHMTPDHEVLTDDGWKPAASNPRPYRPTLRNAHRNRACTQSKQATVLDIPLRLREHGDQARQTGGSRRPSGAYPKLRLPHETTATTTQEPRHVRSPCLLGLAEHARSLSAALTSSVETLWRARHYRLPGVGQIFRGLLGRHERRVQTRPDSRSNRQQQRVFARELPVGELHSPSPEQAQLFASEHQEDLSEDRNPQIHSALSLETRVVYDIANAGPRQRFVVLGDEGPFIVHNCIQALARIVVVEQAIEIEGQLGVPVIGWTHDENLMLVDESDADRVLEQSVEIMSKPPAWAPDLPLAAEGGWAKEYSK